MGTDAMLLVVMEWSFISNLIERDDGKRINEVDEVDEAQQGLETADIASEVYY